MGTSQNYLAARRRAAKMLRDDAVVAARRAVTLAAGSGLTATTEHLKGCADAGADLNAIVAKIPAAWPPLPNVNWPDRAAIERLEQTMRDDPMHPDNWHRRLVNEALAKPQTQRAYFQIRRSLWSWEEFASLRIGARAILEVVIELARDEALPWYVAVPAEDVRRMARLSEGSYARSVRELECLAITRPGRIAHIASGSGMPKFPGRVDRAQPLQPIAQWVARYRRGIPWNRKRAAWWINYDLLCETGRVLPGFIVGNRTLSRTYQGRNRRMGHAPGGWVFADGTGDAKGDGASNGWRGLEEVLTKLGPVAPTGLRAPLWSADGA